MAIFINPSFLQRMQTGFIKQMCLMAALCLVFATSACAPQKRQVMQSGAESIKNVTVSSLDAQFTIGVTTKEDVEKAFGAPTSVRKNVMVNQQNNCDEWRYMYRGSTDSGELQAGTNTSIALGFIPIVGAVASAANTQSAVQKQQFEFVSKVLTISFDKHGKLITYSVDNDTSQVGGL